MIHNGHTPEWHRADRFALLVRRALRETADVELALRCAETAIEIAPESDDDEYKDIGRINQDNQDTPCTTHGIEAFFAFDIFDRRAQGILNKAVEAAKGISAKARKELETLLSARTIQQVSAKLNDWALKYRNQIANLLTGTQFASLMAGMRQVAVRIPHVPSGLGVPDAGLPASLLPEEAISLVDRLKGLRGYARDAAIYELPPDQQAYVKAALESLPAEPPKPILPPRLPADAEAHWPIIDEAARLLSERNLVTREDFDVLDDAARAKAFTVAGVTSEETLGRIRDIMSEVIQTGVDVKEFGERVASEVGEGTFLSEGHMCFLPGTLAEGDVIAASKIRYDGPAVEIETYSGRRLRVTVNHPILTSSGWEYAGDIQKGCDLVCYGDSIKPFNDSAFSPKRRTIHNQNIPSRVEDIFESCFVQTHSWFNLTRPVSPLDFHGDAAFMDGNVSCVGADWLLMDSLDADSLKFDHQIGFMKRSTSSPRCFAKRRQSLFDLRRFASLLAAYRILSLCHLSFDPLLFCNRIKSYPRRSLCIGRASYIDPSIFHTTNKSLKGDVQLYRKLITAFPELVTTDSVIKIKRIWWTGHVYDLQTKTGFIVSQGIVTSNSNVFRTNVQAAFTDGQNKILDHPFVASGFPYASYSAIHDDRVRPNHLALEKLGIQGTNVYRRDDPVFQTFKPPWDYMDRCSWTAMSVRMAAEKGINEAETWMKSGKEPSPPAFVRMPDFRPPPGFQRSLNAAPLSIRLSFEPLANWMDEERSRRRLMLKEATTPIHGQGEHPGSGANDHAKPINKSGKAKIRGRLGRKLGKRMRVPKAWRSLVEGRFSWEPYKGQKGGKGWKNDQTGEIRYQNEKPNDAKESPPKDSSDSASTPHASEGDTARSRVKDALVKLGSATWQGLIQAGHKAGEIEHIAKEWVSSAADMAVSKLPGPAQKLVRGAWIAVRTGTKTSFATYRAGQALAEKVAKAKGASEEQAKRLRAILSVVDVVTMKPVSIGASLLGGPAAGAAVSMVPVGSAAYLAYSGSVEILAKAKKAIAMVSKKG